MNKYQFTIPIFILSSSILPDQEIHAQNIRGSVEVKFNRGGLALLGKFLEKDREEQAILKQKFEPYKFTEDSTLLYLDRVDPNGNPIYLKTLYVQRAGKAMNVDDVYADTSIYNLDGTGVLVGVWDRSVARTTHQEFAGVVNNMDGGSEYSDHSSHVVGTIVSQGVKSSLYKGIAPGATMWSYNWSNAFSELTAAADSGLLVSNHSYGISVTDANKYMYGKYDVYANYFDNIAYNAPYLLPVKAAGNSQDDGFNTADQGFDLLSDGSVAKNTLSVGGLSYSFSQPDISTVSMSSYSSWGPTDDFRLKPDICAPGLFHSTFALHDSSYGNSGGTSMSAPLVTGVVALLQDWNFRKKGYPMLASTAKAIILNTAQDLGIPGPDFKHGWGAINALEAIRVLKMDERFTQVIEDTLANGQSDTISFYYDGVHPLKVLLAWTDPVHAIDYGNYTIEDAYDITLENDLDIVLSSGNGIYLPFTFDTTLAYTQQAQMGDNSRDNVEGIFPGSIPEGEYQIIVSHKDTLTNGVQAYSLVINGQDNPYCPSPRNLALDTLSDGKLQVTWSKMIPNQYADITYSSTINNSSHQTVIMNDTTFVLADANYDDNIDFSIKQFINTIGNLDSSNLITLNLQTPSKPCSTIQYIHGNNITTESVDLEWNATIYDANTIYTLEYKKSSDSLWNDMSNSYPQEGTVIGGLDAGESYDVRIKESCDSSNNHAFYSFTTLSSFGSALGIENFDITASHQNGNNRISIHQHEEIEFVDIAKWSAGSFGPKVRLGIEYIYEDSDIHGDESVYNVNIHTSQGLWSKVISIAHSDHEDDQIKTHIEDNILTINFSRDADAQIDIYNSLGQKIGTENIHQNRIAQIDLNQYSAITQIIAISIGGTRYKTIKYIRK